MDRTLQRDADCNSDARVALVVHVIPIVSIDDVHVISLVPVGRPGGGPRVNQAEPIAAVLEAREAANNHVRLAKDNEAVALAKIAVVAVVWDAIAVVAAALLPCAVVGLPVL